MSKIYKSFVLCSTILLCGYFCFAQTEISKVRTAYLSSYYFTSTYASSVDPIPASLILSRIDTDGSFIRSNRNGTEKDITDSIFKLLYVFENPDSTTYYQDATTKDKVYRSVNYWLNHYPTFAWTGSAMAQPTSLGMILAKLYNNFQADSSNATYGSIIANIKAKAKGFLRYTWSNGTTTTNFNNPNLGNNSSGTYDWQRMGNAGYRIFGYTGIAAACDDSTSMDTLSIIMSNQFPLQVNTLSNPAVVAAAYDGSLFQHCSTNSPGGSQYYNTSYGSDYLRSLSRYAIWVKSTKWTLTTAQQQAWGDIILNGMQWMEYKGNITAHNILGRHNGVKGSVGTQLTPMPSEFTSVVDTTIAEYAPIKALQNKLGNGGYKTYQIDSTKYFWNSNIILNHSAKYFASIRMLSGRTVGAESSDASGGAGLMNFYVSDGSTMLYRRGNEYDTARVGWNWRCIPGATIKQKTGTLPLVPWSAGTESNNYLAGGVSDGKVSIGMFNLNRSNSYALTKAWKAYFAFKDALICVGNSITDADAASGDIYTTLNQTQRVSDIYYSVNSGAQQTVSIGSTLNTSFDITSPSWFWQDSVGYIILPRTGVATNTILSAETRSGNWYNLDHSNPNATVSANIFQLSINHGSIGNGLKDTTYRYVIVPGVSVTDLTNFFNNRILTQGDSSVYIEYNNRIISASYNGYTGVFFTNASNNYATGLGHDSLKISSNNYSAVLVRRNADSSMDIHVSDIRNGFYTSTPVSLGFNRSFGTNSFTPARAYGPVTITPAPDSTLITCNLSKTNQIYFGEPVDIHAVWAAPPVVVTDSSVTIADAFVNGGSSANTNYGLNSYLLATNGSSSPAYTRYTYLKFDLHGVPISTLTNAKLRLYNQSAVTTQWNVYPILTANNGWTETGITWNNRPPYDSTHILDSVAGSGATGYVYWNINSAVKNVGSDSILSLFVMAPLSQSYVYAGFTSRQGASPYNSTQYYPKLIYSYASSAANTAIILPVSLGAFTATTNASSVNLKWNTESESNNKGFYIESSKDGKAYNTITFMNSKAINGNSNIGLMYDYIDNNPVIGMNYYRLRQIDLDGKDVYSPIKAALISGTSNTLDISPNPASNFTKITYKPAGSNANIKVASVNGTQVLYQFVGKGLISSIINISSLAKGMYIINYNNNGIVTSGKLMVQ